MHVISLASVQRRQAKGPLPREDSDADEDLFTLKAISESLSYWEPPGDPEGETVTGLECPVPENTRQVQTVGFIGWGRILRCKC